MCWWKWGIWWFKGSCLKSTVLQIIKSIKLIFIMDSYDELASEVVIWFKAINSIFGNSKVKNIQE